MKVLFHINEENKWPLLIGNITNMIHSGEDFEIEILAHDVAAIALKEKVANNLNFTDSFNYFVKNNVILAVCNNSLNKFDIAKETLLPFVKVVPAGIIEVVTKENEGFNYVKP